MEEIPDLFSGEAAVRRPKGLEYAIGNGVSDAVTEEGGGGVGTVVREDEGRVEVRQPDDGAAIESGIEGAEAQRLCFGAAGSCTVQAGWSWLKVA